METASTNDYITDISTPPSPAKQPTHEKHDTAAANSQPCCLRLFVTHRSCEESVKSLYQQQTRTAVSQLSTEDASKCLGNQQ